jgi:thiol-disulfide isomerase/thioredoxin
MKREIWLIAIVALLFAATGVYFGNKKFATAPTQITKEATAPEHGLLTQSLPDLQGNAQPLQQWRGKVVLANFWAPWCAPCVEEMPELSSLQAEQAKNNVQIIGIGIDSAANIRAFAEKYKIAYPLYVAGMAGGELSRQMGNHAGGLPYTILIGADGQVKKTYLGRLNMQTLRADLKTMH